MRHTLSALMFLAFAVPANADPALDKILECMRNNIPPTVRIQTVEITAVDRAGGERMLRGRLFGTREKDRVRIMMRIDAPTDLAGAAYLVREGDTSDEMFLYLPALRKTRRITGAALDGHLWGTDLSYNDFKQIQNAFTGASAKLEGSAERDGRTVDVIAFQPRKEDGSRYRQIRTEVDQKTCVAIGVEFFEPAGVRKTVNVKPDDLEQERGHWYASDLEVKDLKNGSRTRVRITGVAAGDKLASRYFNPTTFYLGN